MFDIGLLRKNLDDYVPFSQFKIYQTEFNNRLEKFAPWDSLRNVLNEFSGYVRQEDYIKSSMDVKHRMEQINEELAIKYDKNDVHIIKEEFQEYITSQLRNYQTTIEADVDKKDFNTSIERLYKFKEETKR